MKGMGLSSKSLAKQVTAASKKASSTKAAKRGTVKTASRKSSK